MSEHKELIIGSDQNLDYLKIDTHNNTAKLLDICLNNNLIPTITRPTRVTHNTCTLIDNIYLSINLTKKYKSSIIVSDISDHFPCITMIANTKHIDKGLYELKCRKLNDRNLLKIRQSLASIDWSYLENPELDTQASYNEFERILLQSINEFAPEKTRKIKKSSLIKEPWITVGLKTSSNRLNQLYAKAVKKSKEHDLYKKYIIYRNKFNSLKRLAKQNYYKNKIDAFKADSKKLWQTINEITGKCNNKKDTIDYLNINNLKTYNIEKIANGLCKYFSDIGIKLADNIKGSNRNYQEYFFENMQNCIYFYPTNRFEIEKIIQSLKINCHQVMIR
jgi:hypothetical protein